ncbi:NAD-dependent epimerase/dehydratase family protein [Paenibacillus sp. GYB003]|uniref:NAD-dependent epimerase/dehydratase family protein n=1 Tax=Paenibacillus sp. GYB003 TaxID=2994392 RepID=UPI002F964ECB
MNILVLGGSRFFGKQLVRRLVDDGHEVTVATRGFQKLDELKKKVRHAIVDRSDWDSMKGAFSGRSYDVIYDQIAFNAQDAKIAVDLFTGRVNRYVFTSTMAVYDGREEILDERAFDPIDYKVDLTMDRFMYGLSTDRAMYKEGKRQAEAYLYQNATFPVVAVRPPFVISHEDDYTGRFMFHVHKIVNCEPISLVGSSPVSFVSAAELAEFLEYAGTNSDFKGPVNASNTGWLDSEQLSRKIGDLLGVPRFLVTDRRNLPFA